MMMKIFDLNLLSNRRRPGRATLHLRERASIAARHGGARSRVQTVGIAHKKTALDSTNVGSNKLVLLALRLREQELYILALDQVLVLSGISTERSEMREDILVLVRTVANGNETKSRLAIKPLDTAGKTIGRHYTLKS
jgi:hypothetical protein